MGRSSHAGSSDSKVDHSVGSVMTKDGPLRLYNISSCFLHSPWFFVVVIFIDLLILVFKIVVKF